MKDYWKKQTGGGGTWVAQSVTRLPLAPGLILGSRDQDPRRAPCSAGGPSPSALLLLSLSRSLSFSLT